MATNILGGSEKTTIIFFRFKQNDVQFGKEKKHQRNNGRKTNAQTERDHVFI